MGRRFTVTHGNFPNRAAIERAKKLGVAFDMQPDWLYLDGPAIKDVFGAERMKDFMPLRNMIDAGIVVAGGSDHMIRFDARDGHKSLSSFPGHVDRDHAQDGGRQCAWSRSSGLRAWKR